MDSVVRDESQVKDFIGSCWELLKQQYRNRPRGKESTEVRITQNKGKERENSYQKLKRSPMERHTQTHGNLIEIF